MWAASRARRRPPGAPAAIPPTDVSKVHFGSARLMRAYYPTSGRNRTANPREVSECGERVFLPAVNTCNIRADADRRGLAARGADCGSNGARGRAGERSGRYNLHRGSSK